MSPTAAVIDAYARGEIELEPVSQGHGQQSYSLSGGKLYTLATVARWVKPKTWTLRREAL